VSDTVRICNVVHLDDRRAQRRLRDAREPDRTLNQVHRDITNIDQRLACADPVERDRLNRRRRELLRESARLVREAQALVPWPPEGPAAA
jgi:hypothetical protein